MEIQHFSHEHPLIFTEAHDKDNENGDNARKLNARGVWNSYRGVLPTLAVSMSATLSCTNHVQNYLDRPTTPNTLLPSLGFLQNIDWLADATPVNIFLWDSPTLVQSSSLIST
ncbi:hypothetical protein CsSME_00039548 [Camellia sinensis var. sinensis]